MKVRPLLIVTVTALFTIGVFELAAAAPPNIEVPADNRGYEAGTPYDTLRNAGLPGASCVSILKTAMPAERGAHTRISADFANSLSVLKNTLKMSASATFGFGMSHGSASVDYLHGSSVSAYAESVIADAISEIPTSTSTFKFSSKKIEKLFRSNRPAFRRQCGDYFVYSLRKGGHVQIAFSASKSEEHDLQQLRAAISAGGKAWSANATVQKTTEAFLSSGKVSYSVLQEGPPDTSGLGSQDALLAQGAAGPFSFRARASTVHLSAAEPKQGRAIMDYIFAFPDRISKSNAWTMSYTLESYDALVTADPVSVSDRDRALQELSNKYVEELSNAGSLAFIATHRSLFDPGVDSVALSKQIDASNHRIALFEAAAQDCLDASKSCATPSAAIAPAGSFPTFRDPIKFTPLSAVNAPQTDPSWSPANGNQLYLVIRGAWYRNDPGAPDHNGWHYPGDGEGTRLFCTRGFTPGAGSAQATSSGPILVKENVTPYAFLWGFHDGSHFDESNPPRIGVFLPIHPSAVTSAVECKP